MKLYTADKVKELGSKDNFPPCACHGEPMYWSAHGQRFRCRVKGRKWVRGTAAQHNGAYINWRNMNTRCYYEGHNAYPQYGGRGIKVCDRWLAPRFGGEEGALERFIEDMGPRPEGKNSIDRIDPDGDYTPENTRWLSRSENTRRAHAC